MARKTFARRRKVLVVFILLTAGILLAWTASLWPRISRTDVDEDSGRLMPEGFADISLGMTHKELLRVRPDAGELEPENNPLPAPPEWTHEDAGNKGVWSSILFDFKRGRRFPRGLSKVMFEFREGEEGSTAIVEQLLRKSILKYGPSFTMRSHIDIPGFPIPDPDEPPRTMLWRKGDFVVVLRLYLMCKHRRKPALAIRIVTDPDDVKIDETDPVLAKGKVTEMKKAFGPFYDTIRLAREEAARIEANK